MTGRPPEGSLSLHRRRGALVLVGAGALAAAVAYAWRAVSGDGVLGYVVAAALLPVAVLHLAAGWDARTPLLVADRTGLRLRDGNRWTGLRWEDTTALRLAPPRLPRRDGRLVVTDHDGRERTLPLSLVDPADLGTLPDALRLLAGTRTEVSVHVREPEPPAEPAEPPPAATETDTDTDTDTDTESGAEPDAADTDTSEPATDVRSGRRVPRVFAPLLGSKPARAARVARADVVHQPVVTDHGVGQRELRDAAPGRVGLVLEEAPAATLTEAEPASVTEPEPVPEPEPEPEPTAMRAPVDPVVGPQLAEARERLRLSVDDLADRTRIRPHVIEAIEVDDFSSCGGDVYARGHLRALARTLGVDADPLVAGYDARYASAPVTARRVFEAELAGPGRSLRPVSGGPRWSVLIGVVLVLVLVWALARLLLPPVAGDDRGGDRAGRADRSDRAAAAPHGTGDAASRFSDMGQRPQTTRLRLTGVTTDTTDATGTTATEGTPAASGTRVVVRSDSGDVVFRGAIAPGEVRRVDVLGPATVRADDAGAVSARVDGRPTGPLGAPGSEVRTTLGQR